MNPDEREQLLRAMDEDDFRDLGSELVVYVREVDFFGSKHYAVHDASGQPLAIATTPEMALTAIHQVDADMELATVH